MADQTVKTIRYPVKGRKLEQTVTQRTLDLLVAQLENWQQGPGVFGRLNLHACWSIAGVLDRRYQGETVSLFPGLMAFVRKLYEKARNPKWLMLENSMAAHLLYLQDKSGGFIHATSEFEPTFDTSGCPIHWFNPVIALCEYYMWEYADETVKALIPAALDRQWEWALTHSWKAGNGHVGRLTFPGFCGVTNQDLAAVAALALTGKALGNWERYEQYGKPCLDHYLSPAFYYKDIGLFERGDNDNFAERTHYYNVILRLLKTIYGATGEERLMEVFDNVADHIFDAVYVGEDGLTYLARGAKTDPLDKSRVLAWERGPISFNGYPPLILCLQDYLTRHPDGARSRTVEALRDTVAAYIFADGSIPQGLFHSDPLYAVATYPDPEGYYELVLQVLGDDWQDPRPVTPPALCRRAGNVTWKQNGPLWGIEKDGKRVYGGFSRFAGGVTLGPEEKPVWGDYEALEEYDLLEILEG